MSAVRVALLQMAGCGADPDANRAKGESFCRRARDEGADIALFPEMWSVGMTFFDAVAYPVPDGEARDTLIVEAGAAEGVYLASFDLDSLRSYRERESWGNAYRRPRLYRALASEDVLPPFVRRDATR